MLQKELQEKTFVCLFVGAVLCGVALVTPVCNHLSLRHFLIRRQKIYSLLDM